MFYLITVAVIFTFAMILQIPKFNVNANVKMVVFVAWAAYGVIPTVHWTFRMGGLANPVVNVSCVIRNMSNIPMTKKSN